MDRSQQFLKTPLSGRNADEDLQEKITIGIESFPSMSRIKTKLLGENDENVNYIAKDTGATICLRGKGSGFENIDGGIHEPLHIVVKYLNRESKDRTRQLILNLIETVQEDFMETYGKHYPRPRKPEIFPIHHKICLVSNKRDQPLATAAPVPAPSPSNISICTSPISTSNDLSIDNIEKIFIGLDRVPLQFDLRSKIFGPDLNHMRHIEKVTGAVFLLDGGGTAPDKPYNDSTEPPYLLVKYRRPEMKEKARTLIFDLIKMVHEEFLESYSVFPVKPKKPTVIPILNISGSTMAPKLTSAESIKIHSNVSNESPSISNCPPDPVRVSSTLQRTMNGTLAEPKQFSRSEYIEPKLEVKTKSHLINPPWYDELEKASPLIPAIQSQPLFASEQSVPSGKRIPFTPTPQDSNYVFLQKAQKSEIEESFDKVSEVVSSFKTAANVLTQMDARLAEQKTDITHSSTSRNENLNSFRKPSLSQENRMQPLPGNKQQRIIFVDTEFGTCFVVFEQNGEKKLDNNLAEELRGRILDAVKKVVSEFKQTIEVNDEQTEEESLPEDDYYYYKEMQQDVNGHWRNEHDDPRPIKSLLDGKHDPRPIKPLLNDDEYPKEAKQPRLAPRRNTVGGPPSVQRGRQSPSRPSPPRHKPNVSSQSSPPSYQRPAGLVPRPLLPASELRRDNETVRHTPVGRGYRPQSSRSSPARKRPPPLMTLSEPSRENEGTVDKLVEYFDDPDFSETIKLSATQALLDLYRDKPGDEQPSSIKLPALSPPRGKTILKSAPPAKLSKTPIGKPKPLLGTAPLKMRPSMSGSLGGKDGIQNAAQRCLKCLKRGHYADICRSAVSKCQQCGLVGHSILDKGGCPYADKGRCCYVCNEFGHMSLNCPLKHAKDTK